MKTSKLTAIILILSVLGAAIFTSCGKEEKQGIIIEGASGETVVVDKNTQIIEEDTVWYSTERVDISNAFYKEGDFYSWSFINYVGIINGTYYCEVDYQKTNSYDDDREIIAVDSDGKLINSIEISQYLSDDEYYENIFVAEDTVKAIIHKNNQNGSTYYMMDIDVEGGTIGSRNELDVGHATNLGSFANLYIVGDMWIEVYVNYSTSSTNLIINSSDGSTTTVEFNKYFPDEKIDNISEIFQYNDDSILIVADGIRGWNYYFKLNLNNLTMDELCPSGTRWLGRISPSNITALNGHFYVVDRGVVKEVNYETHETTEVFNFNNCNINRYDLNNCYLVDYTDDNIVLSCKLWKENVFTDGYGGFYLYNLTPNDVNPNAGKAVIEVGCLGDITRPIADAIFEFNETSEYYYLHFDNRYDVYDYMEFKYDDPAESRTEELINAQCTLSNQMAIDLLSGDGPDIIIDGFGYGQLNNPNYMLDLSSYYSNMDSSNYFSNVIEGSRIDGAIYQMPLSFSIDGIVTSGSNISNDQVGFTFDEYLQFVDEVCNGTDPIKKPRLQYFNLCVNAMSDLFIDGNTFDFDNKAFRELADYTKNYVFDMDYVVDDYYEIGYGDNPQPAYYVQMGGFVSYLNVYSEHHYQDMRFLGVPSYDGRGPAISVINSVGISAQALNPDACWELIEFMMDTSVQDEIAIGRTFPVNYTSYETTALAMINRYNLILSGDTNYSYSGMTLTGPAADELAVQSFADTCIRNSNVTIADPTIAIIISEEIQPYFVGQKSIDEILEILQDRVETVMNERG